MILDYKYNKYKRDLTVSYITEGGGKKILSFNVDRFKSFYSTERGKYQNWDGTPCDVKWTNQPNTFDIKYYIEEIKEPVKKLLSGKTSPRLYTFDIEVEVSDEFPNPQEAKYPITTISIANPSCDVIILGTRPLDKDGEEYVQKSFNEYITNCQFFQSLGLPTPKIQYIRFETEREMISYFLKNIVSKVSVLTGWNNILFDWQYIQNRIRASYPELSINASSPTNTTSLKNYKDLKGNDVRLYMPDHTLIIDMMDVIAMDTVVLPIKESMSLDYIAYESIGVNKIEYDGSLQDLYNNDYPKYVFYNAIDSVLVQLIDKKFKTLQNIYTQALYCRERIGSCFSKIALTEALVFNDYYEKGIKIVVDDVEETERGKLVGAYVKQPTPGKYNFVCCNDFASLYPSSIITCNLSFENFIGGGFTEEELDRFKKDSRYFVSVNGNVYKNDKEYTFKRIQTTLKNQRGVGKYLAKQLDAQVMLDVEHILKEREVRYRTYADNMTGAMKEIGYDISSSDDLKRMTREELIVFKNKLGDEIVFYQSYEQAMKILANSMYGGASHVKFFWFNMALANDITGEARNLIHMMEHHIPQYLDQNWATLTTLHDKLGIEVDKDVAKKILDTGYHFANIVYGDTDSLYISYENLLKTIQGVGDMDMKRKLDILIKFNTEFMDVHNKEYMNEYFSRRHVISVQNFELETIALSGVWLDVKKRYAQILLWKDGKCFDIDDLPMKIKGLEMIKSSVPKCARDILKRLVRYFLEDNDRGEYLLQRLNTRVQQEKKVFNTADIEEICGSVKVNNYSNYIVDDNNKRGLVVTAKCPWNVRAAGNYNRLRNIYGLPGEPIYGGKLKWYKYKPIGTIKRDVFEYFVFVSKSYPKWADKYAPINRDAMFQQFVLDPLNRILNATGYNDLNIDGSIQISLF